jgi:hypothetical protein
MLALCMVGLVRLSLSFAEAGRSRALSPVDLLFALCTLPSRISFTSETKPWALISRDKGCAFPGCTDPPEWYYLVP